MLKQEYKQIVNAVAKAFDRAIINSRELMDDDGPFSTKTHATPSQIHSIIGVSYYSTGGVQDEGAGWLTSYCRGSKKKKKKNENDRIQLE
jgi:hypothetical protein